MKKEIKSLLKKFPLAYRLFQKTYYFSRGIAERFALGSALEEWYWKKRDSDWADACIEKNPHPHRKLLLEKLAGYSFDNLLEIGCGSGPNLNLIARRFPNCEIAGMDINKNAVETGNNFFAIQGIKNASLFPGKVDDLKKIADKSYDLVLADAVLIYIGPGKIKKIAKEMLRIAKKGLILVEHNSDKKDTLGFYNDGLWLRDYSKLFKTFGFNAKLTKIPSAIWGGDWGKYGYFIEVKFR